MLKRTLTIIGIFILGIGGGIFADQTLWPYFVERPLFYQYKEEITIQENVALQKAIEKVEKAVVGIKVKTEKGKVLEGSGLIVTADGLIVTLAELLPQDSTLNVFLDQKLVDGQVLKKRTKENLALIKIEEKNLKTCSFADLEKIKLGERVFLIGVVISQNLGLVVNEGIVRSLNQNSIQTNISEKDVLKGSPLFDIEGNVLGLNIIDSEGRVSVIPISKIKEFLGF